MKVRLLISAIVCFLLSACVPYPVRDTPPVRGQVVDARTHRPVVGARVDFPDSHTTGTVTDAQGRFSLSESRKFGFVGLLPYDAVPGFVPLEVRGEHYQLFRTRVRFRSFDEPQSLAVTLQPVP